RVVAASVTDPAWLTEIPAYRPTLMIGEGLTMYLTEQDGTALLRRVVDRFGSGELQFDAFNWLGIKSQWLNTVVRRSGSTLHWAINGPDDIIEAVPGVRLLAWERWFESYTFAQLPRSSRALGKAMSQVHAVANMSQYHRYAFGPSDGKA
ncbi:MAG TPA: class I SAM-dependent methyltransferase, partial [Mycobacterium sp.]